MNISLIIVVLLVVLVWISEVIEYNLLHPAKCKSYINFDNSFHRTDLQSGGILLYRNRHNRDILKYRPILILHGNGGNIDGFYDMYRDLVDKGYRVYLLEYAGYGESREHKAKPKTMVQNLQEAYSLIPDMEHGIIVGVSMGGGVIGQFLRDDSANPAQVVLINTFYDLPQLVSEISIPGMSYLVQTRWNSAVGLKRYTSNNGRVVIVGTQDDSLINIRHSHKLASFCGNNVKLVILPHGGHNSSPMIHMNKWTSHLLSHTPSH